MRLNRRLTTILMAALLLILAACAPEGQREVGGGSGGDIGNLGDNITMHGEDDSITRIFYETPRMGKGIERDRDARGVNDDS